MDFELQVRTQILWGSAGLVAILQDWCYRELIGYLSHSGYLDARVNLCSGD